MKRKLCFLFTFCLFSMSLNSFVHAANSWELITDKNGQVQKVPAKDSIDLDEIQRELDYERSLHTYYPVINPNKTLTFDFDNPDYIPVADYIKQNIDENFDLNTYEATSFEYEFDNGRKNGDGLAKFNFFVGEMRTDVSYTIHIKKNKVNEISLYKKPIYNIDISKIPILNVSEYKLKKMSVKPEMYEAGFEVIEQLIEKRLDLDTMKPYYIVFNTYRDKSNPNYETMDHFIYGLDE